MLNEKEKFEKYVRVQKSGVTNMCMVSNVCVLTCLNREDVLDIMEKYSELSEKYPEVIE